MSIKGFLINGTTQRYDYESLDNKPVIPSGSGVSDELKLALLQMAQKVAYIDAQGQTYYQDLYDALYSAALTSITAAYTQSGTVYNTDSLDSLKTDLVVTAHYDDNTSEVITNYTLSGDLTVGTSVITASYQGKTATFNVTVTRAAGTYSISNNLTGCTNSNSAATVAENAAYNATITANTGYTLTGATVNITMGGTALTGVYQNGTISIPNVTGDVVITVVATAVTLSSISAVFNQGSNVIYDTDSLDTLKQYLIVTAVYSDSSTATVPSADYTLSGTLAEGTSTITVSYGGKTTTFSVTVSAAPSYVTNGLIHQWDAINNTRSGHNASVNVWEDLVGTNDLTVNNYSNITWLDNAVQFTGVTGTRFLGSEASTDATGKTVEVVFSVATARTEAICSVFHSTQYVNYAYGKIALYSDSTFGVKGQSDKTYVNGVSDITNFHSISASYSAANAVQNVFANAQTATLGTATHSMSTSSSNPSVGASATSYDYAFSGKVHAIRIYDRILTADEVSQNYAVDVFRFNLG